jgi:hypothetical protein
MDDIVARDAVVFTGRMSTFGGPKDLGVAPHEGLALINPSEIDKYPNLFLPAQPAGTSGLARRLDPNAFYVACRWDYAKTPREKLKTTTVLVTNPKTGAEVEAQPVTWGPDPATGRVADLSDGLAAKLDLETDQICSVRVPAAAVLSFEGGVLNKVFGNDSPGQAALSTWNVLDEESNEIDGKGTEQNVGDFPGLYRELNKRDHAALCLSGGGIRSGSFALGLMQGLAGLPSPGIASYLGQFDYLSTVSGGGYIGGWFSAWIMRAKNARNQGVADEVLRTLADQSAAKDEAPAIENLRINSNYLTPKVGAMSADAWADVAMYLRNLILNWFVMVPVVVLLVLAAKGYSLLPAYLATKDLSSLGIGTIILSGAFVTVLFLSYQTSGRPTQGISNRSQSWFLFCDLTPVTLASVVLVCLFSPNEIFKWFAGRFSSTDESIVPLYAAAGAIGAGLYALSWLFAAIWRGHANAYDKGLGKVSDPMARDFVDFLAWSVAGALFGLFLVVGLKTLWITTNATENALSLRVVLMIVFGPPWLLLSHLIAEMLFVGVISFEKTSDNDREWLARSAGWYGIVIVGWTAFFGLVLLGTYLSEDLAKTAAKWLGPIGGISGLISLILGKTPLTAINTADRKQDAKSLSLDTILNVTVPVFAASLLVATSAALDRLLFSKQFWPTEVLDDPGNVKSLFWGATVVTVLLTLIAPRFVNINRFSLHALYRNRIVRAFLGASRAPDRPMRNLFTDFDDHDNPHMSELWQRGTEPQADDWRPFHIVNMTLNVVSSKNLAWQERKAESFIVSALHSGSGSKTFDGPGAYQRTEQYGDSDGGISLGTAVAISGAAASPQMGYHSSPALAFLMSLFNVRLGWWLPNPGRAGAGYYRADGPKYALRPLLSEMFGLTTDTRSFVYLSDGGHFENLALYEMVRRRCRYIVVSDAGCDPYYSFEDLGNALRKIKIDLRVDIEFFQLDRVRMRPQENIKQQYHCVGIIKYDDADGGDAKNGILLYIKPGLTLLEPPDIISYANAHPSFPHEPTSDQWFTESQFESYRHLGFFVGGAIVNQARSTEKTVASLPDLLRSLIRLDETAEAKYGATL